MSTRSSVARTPTSGAAGWSRSASDLLSLAKPRLSSLVIFTTGGAAWLAGGNTAWPRLIAAVVGTSLIVGAANALNCYLERDVDGLMKRTADRPLPAGRMAPEVALWLGRVLMFIGFPILTLGTNLLTGALAGLALASYVLVYTPLKRRSAHATLVGAIPGALPPLIGWTAITGRIEPAGMVLFLILCLWQLPHFYAISLFRRTEYERAGFVVLPTTLGPTATRRRIVLYTALLVPASLLLVPLGVTGVVYAAVALLAGLGFLAAAFGGLRENATNAWARRFFFGSLIYLTTLVAGMVADVILV